MRWIGGRRLSGKGGERKGRNRRMKEDKVVRPMRNRCRVLGEMG